ncbi:MAG TPA: type VI secretion system-associated protein TagF, partial [Polyangiales bacterium]
PCAHRASRRRLLMSHAPASLYGKLPRELDYQRINLHSQSALALDAWLQASNQALAAANAEWPHSRLRFLLTFQERSLVGALAPSRDRAGRKFPLAVFREHVIPLQGELALLSALTFLDKLDAALDELMTASKDQARDILAQVAPLGSAQAAAGTLHTWLRETRATEFARVLGPGKEPELRPTLRDLRQRTQIAGNAAPTFDLPLTREEDVLAWLALTATGSARPSALWSSQAEPPRLLLRFAAPSDRTLLWFSSRAARSPALQRVGSQQYAADVLPAELCLLSLRDELRASPQVHHP